MEGGREGRRGFLFFKECRLYVFDGGEEVALKGRLEGTIERHEERGEMRDVGWGEGEALGRLRVCGLK